MHGQRIRLATLVGHVEGRVRLGGEDAFGAEAAQLVSRHGLGVAASEGLGVAAGKGLLGGGAEAAQLVGREGLLRGGAEAAQLVLA